MTAGALKKTFADLALLGEETRVELIRGELVPKAAPMAEHSEIETVLASWLTWRFQRTPGARWPGGWWIRLEIHVEYDAHEVFCHDLAGWRRDRHDKPRGWPVTARPDWVCEVLSRGHERRDRVTKLETLHAAGVPHYWLVDHDKRTVEIRRHEAAGYRLVQTFAAGEIVRAEPFNSLELRSGVIFDDEDDEP